jgi:hypothetical protein
MERRRMSTRTEKTCGLSPSRALIYTLRFRAFAEHAGIGREGYARLTKYTPTAVVVWDNGSYAALTSGFARSGAEAPVQIVDVESPDDDAGAFEVIADSFDGYLQRTLEFLIARRNYALYWAP